jgi:hypothetical protein
VAVTRDLTGKLRAVAAKPAADGTATRESFIHIISRLSAEEAATSKPTCAPSLLMCAVVIDWRHATAPARSDRPLSEGPANPDRGIHRAMAFLQWL